ncbi:MAG: hypothetical protein IJP92_02655 [Lachnospiraceae bacterium]|nr:hypothetical protein [Lachnospiraceae bacterium]
MNAPTLLVGLGGTGSEIVQRVYNQATEAQRESIGFVVFDTDVNELRRIEEKTPAIHTVQTSTRLTVGEYLDADHYSRDTWFPVNRILNGKALTEGAGQVRAISRLALNTTIQQGRMNPLNEAIEELYKLSGKSLTQSPRVILTGSLCGGTGSGLILPVAMYIRNFMSTKLQQGSSIIRGFFILPEVYNDVITTQSERNNLRCNAYAAVREIDAFMMKDDGSLGEQYDLHFMAPRAGSKNQDEYTGRPMDFCFLFDAQNLDGMKLNSFSEYKEHAANCIYGMAIAPTSKRSNSSEDNVIREIVFSGGRNRFAGAGTSLLIYPTDDVKKYLALSWTRDSITDEWLDIDRQFADEQKTIKSMKQQGYQVADLDRASHYIDIVNQGFAEQKAFRSAIRNLCIEFDAKGFVEKNVKWNQYVEELENYVNNMVSDHKEELADMISDIRRKEEAANDKNAAGADFSQWYQQLLGYKNATIKSTERIARNATYSLFKDKKDYTKTDQKYRLEYWLRAKEVFIHPNAVRFFIYNAIAELRQKEAECKAEAEDIREFWKNFEKNTFDIDETEDHVETETEYFEMMKLNEDGRFGRIRYRGKIKEGKSNLVDQMSALFNKTNDYWSICCSQMVFREAISYLTNLSAAFHDFYDVLDRNVAKIGKEIDQLEEKYDYRPGMALRYVCADKMCLRGLADEVVNLGSSLDIPSDLSSKIFNRMKRYALADKKPESEAYFTDAFQETVVKYLEGEVMGHYMSVVDMDVLTALEREAKFQKPEVAYDDNEAKLHAQNAIEQAIRLSKPFIESPAGKEPRVITACAYSTDLTDPIKADFPGRKQFVSKHLKSNGGVEDEGIDRNMILFFSSVYDIRANDLSKFRPPQKTQTKDQPDGEYYKAYYELVEMLHPESHRSRAITPHIDRWWHVITKLPDLDEQSQEDQEKRIYRSFFWGMLGQFVRLVKDNEKKNIYSANEVRLNLKSTDDLDQLVVSNGTSCDHLYEVLDAFTIYPRLVRLVSDRVESLIDNDKYAKTPLENSTLYKYIHSFRVDEFPLQGEDGSDKVRCMLDLPMLMKMSVPSELYYEKNMIQLLATIVSEIKAYHAHFVTQKELNIVYGNFLYKQFNRFIEDMKSDVKHYPDLFNDSLFIYQCQMIAKELEEIGMLDEAENVENTWRKLRSK